MEVATDTSNDTACMVLHVKDRQTCVNDVTPKPVTKLIAALINIAFARSGSKFQSEIRNQRVLPRDQGYCETEYKSWMSDNCSKACGKCTKSTDTCKDEYDVSCTRWQLQGKCDTDAEQDQLSKLF